MASKENLKNNNDTGKWLIGGLNYIV